MKFIHDIGDALLAFLMTLIPGTAGAAVSLVYEQDLTWTKRVTQMMVGITVSYFARNVAASVTGWDEYLLQAVGFVVGMTAFKATPAMIAGVVERAPLLLTLVDRLLGKKEAR